MIVFSAEFEAWARQADYDVFREDTAVFVASANGGEIRFSVVDAGGTYELTRAERADDPVRVMRSDDIVDVERYLTAQLGIAVRALESLSRVRLPFETTDTAPGFDFVLLGDGWSSLRRADGTMISAQFIDTSMHPAVRFSYYADAAPDAIRDSYSSPSGAPLFAAA